MKKINKIKNMSTKDFAEWYAQHVICTLCEFRRKCPTYKTCDESVNKNLCLKHIEKCLNADDNIRKELNYMNKKLKSCPFCGSTYAPDYYEDEYTNFKIICKLKKGGCGASTALCDSLDTAIKSWNKRNEANYETK